ncbi:hypothetical protein ACFFLM_02725 [Deinococcus oregonensis]|uniref:Uncharacterized protein n=1 Tax=Deinococcus oregonensis TaxID=1805970 RepID=A0ABV6ATR7_9DEIO
MGKTGVVFPAIPAAAMSQATSKPRGVDVSPFINQAKAAGGTFYFPITDNIVEVNGIMSSAMQQVYVGKTQAPQR